MTLKELKKFQISRTELKSINGSSKDVDICDAVNKCMQTAFNNGNTFLIPVCEETLDPSHSCRG
ncbi:hypothetical protein EV197_2434 [Aquimarina brevivitae]|uniref:Uncharacterized protein n=2 Tax=Aquimarina brevivitae TaxID=323412 RepID=A0A4Q7P1V9_9FLAO|nr:hypothetical protein EV197_2434 [Aquimarina brevivitae]